MRFCAGSAFQLSLQLVGTNNSDIEPGFVDWRVGYKTVIRRYSTASIHGVCVLKVFSAGEFSTIAAGAKSLRSDELIANCT